MANNTPIGNIDFINGAEALSALQRNPQLASIICTGTLTTSFSASTIYAVIGDGGTVKLADITTRYVFGNNAGAQINAIYPFGLPMNTPPPGGAVFAVLGSTGNNVTVVYK